MTTLETGTPALPTDHGTEDPHAGPGDALPVAGPGPFAAAPKWLGSGDHKITGLLYLIGGLIGIAAAVVVNVVIAIERVDGDDILLDESLSQLFDAQRVLLVFGAVIPTALALSVAIVPLQLGARAIAFGRAAGLGFWMWVSGLVLNLVALLGNGGTLGLDDDMVGLFIASLALMAIGVTVTAGSVVTTVLTTRAPGMTMRRVPFFSWAALITSIGIVLMMPVYAGTLVYLFVDHRNARTGFGGNSGVYTWAGWLFTQPATYLFALPAIGAFAEVLPVTFRKRTPARGVMIAGLGLVGVAALAGVTQQNVHSLPWSGSDLNLDDLGTKVEDLAPVGLFYGLPILGLVLVLLMALVLAKPQKGGGRPVLTPGLAFSLFGYGMVFVGMFGTLLYAVDDLALNGTVFEEAALVYIVYGALLGIMGGLAYWAPKLWGFAPPAAKLAGLAFLGVLSTVLASFPHYIAGFLDQPAGGAYDNSDLTFWNILVLIGHTLMLLTLLGFIGLMAAEYRSRGDGPGDDPWDGQTLEWATTSPAPVDNFVDVPLVHSAEPLLDLKSVGRPAATADGSTS